MNEESFEKVERDIHAKFKTQPANCWKKFSNKKQGILDKWYEEVCQTFLNEYIALKQQQQPHPRKVERR